MWIEILQNPDLIFYILAVEGLLLCLLQLRTNGLLKKEGRLHRVKTEKIRALKEEVKKGESKIPVVKFNEACKTQETFSETKKQEQKRQPGRECSQKECFDAGEMKVLQELMAEYFG